VIFGIISSAINRWAIINLSLPGQTDAFVIRHFPSVHLDKNLFEVEIVDRDVGVPGVFQLCDEFFIKIVDADGGGRAADFALQGVGDGKSVGEIVAGGDAQAFDALFQFVEFAVEGDFAVAEDRDAAGDALEVGGDVRRKQDGAIRGLVDDF